MARRKTKRTRYSRSATRARRRRYRRAAANRKLLARLQRKLARIGGKKRNRKRRHIGHFDISFAEANRVRRMKGRKPLSRGQYRYRVGHKLPVTI